MKLISFFKKFLEDTVNLNKTRYDIATTGIGAITDFLKSNENLKNYFVGISPQGSYRQKTIIRPSSDEHEFDVDLLFDMKRENAWEPKDYLSKIADEFRATDRYSDLVDTRNKSRCVTIDYESDFHIDIIPSIQSNVGSVIMNKTTNEYEQTDGEGYAEWFEMQNVTANNFLVPSVRLLKYIRDVKQQFVAKSILLTTLLGYQIYTNNDSSIAFSDLPTAFSTIINRLDTYLQLHYDMPIVINPVLPSESFNRHWDQDKYSQFRDIMHELNIKVNDAYGEENEAESIKKWTEIFGGKFPSGESISPSKTLNENSDTEQFLSDLNIDYVKNPYIFKIDGKVTKTNGFEYLLTHNRNSVGKHRKIEFFIDMSDIPLPYYVLWKVKNTGQEAKAASQLRGEILKDDGNKIRVEHTLYSGNHYVECYAIKNGVCISQDKVDVLIP